MPDSVSVRHKCHIPKKMFLTALARPQPDQNFDGRVGIWRICQERVCDRTTLYHQRGDAYIHDCTLHVDLYCQYMVETDDVARLPVIVQQEGASPYTGHGNVIFFNQQGQKNG